MFNYLSTTIEAYHIIFIILMFGMLIGNLEYVVNNKLYTSEGVLDWKILRTYWPDNSMIRKILQPLFDTNAFSLIFPIRAILLISLLILPMTSMYSWVILLAVLLSYLITNLATFYGSDGSDQMSVLILTTIFFCTVPFTNESILRTGLIFIAAQACLSYFSAGISKLFSKQWRRGDAVKEIFRTRTYGSKQVYFFIKDKNWLNYFLCWSVIIAECSFPLVLIIPLKVGIFFLIWGCVFHLLNSVIMGLNTFLWAFLASYPAIIFVNLLLN